MEDITSNLNYAHLQLHEPTKCNDIVGKKKGKKSETIKNQQSRIGCEMQFINLAGEFRAEMLR